MSLNLDKYLEVKQQLAKFKKIELQMRMEILEDSFGHDNMGIVNCVASGYAIKGSFGTSTKIDITAEDYDLLPEYAQDCINWKPALNKAFYDGLSEKDSIVLEDYITTKPSLPTLTLKDLADE